MNLISWYRSIFNGFLGVILIASTFLSAKDLEKAIFAGGCFWCLQSDFDHVSGVVSTTSGYIGGDKVNPTYKEVSAGGTGYVEAVQVIFDSSKVTYPQLLDFFWHNVDPTRNDGQFCDSGDQYRPVIFYLTEIQEREAEVSKDALVQEGKIKPILVEILPAKKFYAAENYHQQYYKKNPIRYKFYRMNCGRDKRLKTLWGNP